MADTPVGITAVFGTSNFTSALTGIGIDGVSREAIETSHFGSTTYKEYIVAKLLEPGEITLSIQFDPDQIPPATDARELLTLTFPVPVGQTNGATLAGTGFVMSWNMGADDQDGLMTAEITWKFDGGANSGTAPAWTASS